MNEKQITLIKSSWINFRRINETIAADAFYSKLFYDDPRIKKMLPNDLQTEYGQMTEIITTFIVSLGSNNVACENFLSTLLKKYASYHAKPVHYKLAANALLWTLQKGLGNDWSAAVQEAWLTCYHELEDKLMSAIAQ